MNTKLNQHQDQQPFSAVSPNRRDYRLRYWVGGSGDNNRVPSLWFGNEAFYSHRPIAPAKNYNGSQSGRHKHGIAANSIARTDR